MAEDKKVYDGLNAAMDELAGTEYAQEIRAHADACGLPSSPEYADVDFLLGYVVGRLVRVVAPVDLARHVAFLGERLRAAFGVA